MRHRGVHVGNFYLAEKEAGDAFTEQDEEILVLFASQAATAIANARAYRAERRARADLEALIETSPVGVAVLDGRTGHPVSLNREARRIVESLRMPGHTAEDLLGILTCRFTDGREIALDRLPLASALSRAETVRAEEIVLTTPDGRSVTTLVNATPIDAEDGTLASVVVTLQDLAPLQELERMRAQFLGMVSHELRVPLTSIKGSSAAALGASRPVAPAETREFFRIIDDQADRMIGLIADLLDAGRIETGTLSVSPEPSQVGALVDQARSTFVSGGGRHAVRIDLPPDLPPVLADRQRIVQVLNNLLANAARHSPDSAAIRIAAQRDGVHVAVSVSDEGRGIAPERLRHLFRKYPAAGDREDGLGGGLGLAICKGLVEAHGGRIRAESGGVGLGARFTFTLPVAATAVAVPGRPDRPGAQTEAAPILVVDDDPETLRHVRDTLTDAGFAPLVTGDHRQILHILLAEKAPAGAARPDAARDRRDRAHADHSGARRPARHLHLRLRARRDHRPRARGRRRRLHRQALLADRAHGADPGGPAAALGGCPVYAPAPRHRLRPAPGHRGRARGGTDGDRVRAAARSFRGRRPGPDPRDPAAPGLGRTRQGQFQDRARLRQAAAQQAWRRCRAPRPDLQRARGRLPHGPARRPVAPRRSASNRLRYAAATMPSARSRSSMPEHSATN